jgi:4'-phosphopantetheinyl transferase
MGPERQPAPDEVHVWLARLDPETEQSWCRRVAATTAEERDRASRFRRAEDRERYLAAHGALRLLLGRYLTCDPLTLHFAVSTNGKPFLENQELQFNLSHSGGIALIAVAQSRQVGADIEQVRPMPDLQAVAARVCTPVELVRLSGLAGRERECAFFAMWTRKEALAKATGEGIGAIVGDGSEDLGGGDGRWTVTEVNVVPGYAACVAAEGAGWTLVRHELTDDHGD